jgi:hypothetical protein
VTAVFSDNLSFGPFTGADWEIRAGISQGNAGTLVAAGTTISPLIINTGRGGFGLPEFMVEVTGLNVFLPMLPSGQHYWLNVTPILSNGRSFNSTTSGTNCVGTPCGNDQNAFFNSNYFGANFTSTSNEAQPFDYSMGVIGNAVPEPPPWAMMALGAVVLVGVQRLVRQKKA